MRRRAAALTLVLPWLVEAATIVPAQVEPLVIRVSEAPTPLFTLIEPGLSGVAAGNPYDDPEMWGRRYAEFSGGAVGTGLAVGDFDRDGRPDLFVVNKTAPDRLYRQTAPFVFEDVTARAGVGGDAAWGTGATFADIDGDGWLDLYVCRMAAPNSFYRNNGDGTFTDRAAAAGIDIATGSVLGGFEDYDRDGDLDFFLLTNLSDAAHAPAGDPDRLYRNNGDGTFADVTSAAGLRSAPDRGHSATWWDADDDGWPDLYVANDFEVPDRLYRNRRDGTFVEIASGALPHLPWYSMGADFGDIDNDGLFDLFVADMAGTTHLKRQTFALAQGVLAEASAFESPPQYTLNSLYLNAGGARFLEIARLAGVDRTDWTWSPVFGDFDNDGWEDLHLTNGMVRDFAHADLIARLRQAATPAQMISLSRRSPVLNEENRAFRNTGQLGFEDVTVAWGLRDLGVSFGSVAADLDGDGDLDLAYGNFDRPVSLYRNNSQSNRIIVSLRARGSNRQAVGARLFATTSMGRQSRRLTLSRGALSSTPAEAHFGLGADQSIRRLEIHWPDGRVDVAENLEANHRYRFEQSFIPDSDGEPVAARSGNPIFAQVAASGLTFEQRNARFDEFGAQPLLPLRQQNLDAGMAWGDANGDGNTDVYFAGGAGQPGRLYLNSGDGTFAPDVHPQPWTSPVAAHEIAPLWTDANADGAVDLLVTHGGVEHPESSPERVNRLYLNDGRGHFFEAPPEVFAAASVGGSVATAADFDRDGDLDLFIGGPALPGRYPLSSPSLLWENRTGIFHPATTGIEAALSTLGAVTAAIWSDANGDGWPDLLVAPHWGPVRLFLNRGNGSFEDATAATGLSDRTGWWNSIEAGDFDGDGDMDYALGNAGLNTSYHASVSSPVQLHLGDFDDSGQMQIVESYVEHGRLLPRRNLAAMAKAMPFLRRLFPSTARFGEASLDEIFVLAEASVRSATEMAHGILLNDGTGRFEFRELPRMAQAGPVFGIAARDFDGDATIDLLLVQNFHGTPPEAAPFDGGRGLLLRGLGDGRFDALPIGESGVDLPGESRGLAIADLDHDGWPDAVVTRSNGPVVVLGNRGPTNGRNSFAVALRGVAGNPRAIGASVRVIHRSGRRQCSELAAGAGFLSQSEPLAFFGWRTEDPPESVEVRWPDGRTTSAAWSPERVIVLSLPPGSGAP